MRTHAGASSPEDAAVREPWPTTAPDAQTLRRYWLSQAQWSLGVLAACEDAGMFKTDPPSALWDRWKVALGQMQHGHDVALALGVLLDVDEERANDLAARIWRAADAGDAYGEWIWEWGEAEGLHMQALYDAGRALPLASTPQEPT